MVTTTMLMVLPAPFSLFSPLLFLVAHSPFSHYILFYLWMRFFYYYIVCRSVAPPPPITEIGLSTHVSLARSVRCVPGAASSILASGTFVVVFHLLCETNGVPSPLVAQGQHKGEEIIAREKNDYQEETETNNVSVWHFKTPTSLLLITCFVSIWSGVVKPCSFESKASVINGQAKRRAVIIIIIISTIFASI